MYVWGNTWEQAKRHGECLHYLFEVAVNLRNLGVQDLCAAPRVQPMRKRLRGVGDTNGSSRFNYIIFDIEGTTTPISFVKEVLFPFAVDNIEEYFTIHWSDDVVREDIHDLCAMAGSSPESMTPSSLASFAKTLMNSDSKASSLKNIQGHIWEKAYTSGKIFGMLFDDVPLAFERIANSGTRIAIYSSGSRRAQYLLFKHSEKGDLTSLISCYFDTSVGPKRSPTSYSNILLSIGQDARDVLFVTDVPEEADSAAAIGMNVKLSSRPGNLALPKNIQYEQISSFLSI